MTLLSTEDLENYAEVLYWALRTSRVPKFENGDMILIRFDVAGADLADALFRLLIREHLNPVPVVRPTSAMEASFYGETSMGQLMFQRPGMKVEYEQCAGVATILAPDSLHRGAPIDPKVVSVADEAAHGITDVLADRRRKGEIGWTVCAYPTPALAEISGMELSEYAARLARACWLNMPYPVKEWQRMRKELGEICTWLGSLKAVGFKMESESSDLFVEPGRFRRFIGVSGYNIPGNEVYLSPDWRGVSGVFHADMPSIRLGHMVAGARLEFSSGMLVNAHAAKGLDFLVRQVGAVNGATRVGEFSMTDKRYSRVDDFLGLTLLNENYGGEFGNCHIALGASNPESYSGPSYELTYDRWTELGFNTSAIHWDLVNTEPKRVTAVLPTGRKVTVYEDGLFQM